MVCGSRKSIQFGRKPLLETEFKGTKTFPSKRQVAVTEQKVQMPLNCGQPESKARNERQIVLGTCGGA